MLGLSLWPFAYEIVLWSESMGFSGIDPKLMEQHKEVIDRLREQTTAGLGVLVLAVIPAVTEEFFFRGFLMQSLRRHTSTGQAILFSSILFGAFHLVTEAPLISRFLATSALGLALGFVAWRTGSVLPGMIVHAIHNGLLVILLHYQEKVEAWGIGVQQQRHIPMPWLAAAFLGMLTTGAVLYWKGRNSEVQPAQETLM